MSPGEASDFWTKEVVKTAKDQPAAFLRKMFEKLLVLFNGHEAADNHHIGFVSRFAGFFRLPFFSIWFIFPLGLAGMMLGIPGDRKAKALGLIALTYAMTLVVFFTNVRLRLPILVIVIPFAAAGLIRLHDHIRSRRFRKAGTFTGVAAFFFILAFLPVRGTDDMTAYYNTHAIILNSRGMTDEAIRYWEHSSEMQKPYSAYANLGLASVYYKKGLEKKSAEYFQKVPDTSFAASEKYELLGDILMHKKQEKAAGRAYEKALAVNSGQLRTWGKLIKLYDKLDQQKAVKSRKELAYIRSFF
ncbi:MAG: tetratricopeptide repeat protein [Deltaproteobacteria bacterium]|nr:tetratricopeptide repeat protein [Deltaproteobacteria bacterium]